jgi:demethylmenaquinone methyltransferase/2-methoxy-6-polyprenyl-1,4-benzoquinol methylase
VKWPGYSLETIRRRYNLIGPRLVVFEWLFLMPRGIRARAVASLGLRRGARVLELGCGSGRNLPHLEEAVGPEGHIVGVDVSDRSLDAARRRCERCGWSNVTLIEADAASADLEGPFDAALFSLCYAVIPDRSVALRRAWEALRPGGRLVVMDSRPAPGPWGRITRPLLHWVSRATVLGDPDVRPWDDLAALAGTVELESMRGGVYFTCAAEKRPGSP